MRTKLTRRKQILDTAKEPETAILVGIMSRHQNEQEVKDYLDELEFLASTAGVITIKRFVQRLEKPDIRTFVGSGKVLEIKKFIEENNTHLLIFDDELSPSQIRNLEKELGRKVLDRTNLILDIFAARAKTAHAKTQVELAQYQYLLPRLAGMWTHLERQRGGIGMRGPGEKEIETDRRIVRDRIALLKEDLQKIDRQMASQRKNRGELIRIALVGYTNVGKSTIMNLLSKSDVFAENKLFATLDTTVRKVVIDNVPFLLSDTVGFIRKLPTHLIESFKSTLDEVREADILLHIVDISHPNFEDQINVVNQTLTDIKAHDKTTLLVFNKIDAYTYEEKEADDLGPVTKRNLSLEQLEKTWMGKIQGPCVFISAADKKNIENLKSMLYKMAKELFGKRYPYLTANY
jgi:GTP-binding protein HflX